MSYKDTLNYLDQFINYERTPPAGYGSHFTLKRIKDLLHLLGDPQKDLKIIHIAGSKGKGSTAALITSILREAGYRVGLYTSPHLTSCRERIKIDGEMITKQSFVEVIEKIKPYLDRFKEKITFFEIFTAAAFLYFKERGVDFAVMETGLGGRLDATNAAESMVSIITPISIEHTNFLGNTIQEIAREKAGIIKKDSMVVSAAQEIDALCEIEEAVKNTGVSLSLVGRDIHIDEMSFDRDSQHFNIWTRFTEYSLLELNLRGKYQMMNAATAIGAIEALRAYNIFISQETVRNGISKATWPGRLEKINENPLTIVDGAQNKASAEALLDAIKRHFRFERLLLVLGMSRDKDIEGICKILTPAAAEIVLARSENPRAATLKEIARYIKDRPVRGFEDSKAALMHAMSIAGSKDLVLVTGSLFLVGEIREAIKTFTYETQS